ncbi:hypothetical protein LCGC14_0282620 [marine sediment metagenome]|uniref:Uncharacterized protein n=1 Tax=marine sediment metagenome TaxID=412755 RepID=A0A0F9X100_9ZZZZ
MEKRRLTHNQRVQLSQLMKRYDDMMTQLIVRAKDTVAMKSPSDRLSQNEDYRKMVLSYHERFAKVLTDKGLMLPIFEKASEQALITANYIVAGQSRSDLRNHIDRSRCDLLHGMEGDLINVIYQCNGRQNDDLI